jgi:hypothetical protein
VTIIIAVVLVAPFAFSLGMLFADLFPSTPSRFYQHRTRTQCMLAAIGRLGKKKRPSRSQLIAKISATSKKRSDAARHERRCVLQAVLATPVVEPSPITTNVVLDLLVGKKNRQAILRTLAVKAECRANRRNHALRMKLRTRKVAVAKVAIPKVQLSDEYRELLGQQAAAGASRIW